MEKSFDFSALLQNHEKKHKTRPTQFISVAGGIRKRLESNIRIRKSNRLSVFDSIRNLPKCDSPKKQLDPISKEEHRRMQLEKWKEEREKKKKQAAAQKKKPFVAGVAHAPLTFVPPPPPKAVPSTSGRVTRSQSAKNFAIKTKPSKTTTEQVKTQSFAPRNASFKAPEIKNMIKAPTLAPVSKIKKVKEIAFDPVVLDTVKDNKKYSLKSETKITETKRNVNDKVEKKTRGKVNKSAAVSKETQHSGDKLSSVPKRTQLQTRSATRTADKVAHKSLEGRLSPIGERSVSKSKTSRKSVESLSDAMLSSDLEQPKSKIKPSRGSLQGSGSITPPTKQSVDKLTPKMAIPKSESSSEEKLRSPKSPVDVPMTPEQIVEEAARNSPFVTQSRGKGNARREAKKKIDEGLFEEDTCNADSVDHFRRQLNSEINRMTELCDTWEKISEQMPLPETVQEAVLGAVGQARLLMSHKLQQFASLVARCERPEPGQALVTPADLHGFWDMVFMQVVNVDVRFKKLEEMRARNWAEEAPAAPRRKVAPKARPVAKPAAASRLRDVIAAARKAKKQEGQLQDTENVTLEPPAEPAKTFEAGFFCVRSSVRSPATPARPARPSMLKAVLSSEAKKSASKSLTSIAMLRASLIGKNVENDSPSVEQVAPLTPVNLQATPGRSILKPVNVPSSKKSIKVVLFDDSDVDTHENSHEAAENDRAANGVEKLDPEEFCLGVNVEKGKRKNSLKENKPRRKSLLRQDATEEPSPVMTRSRRKSMNTPTIAAFKDADEKTPKRTSRRKKTLQEVEVNVVEENNCTPKRSSRRKSVLQANVA